MKSRLCPPAAAISSARRARAWPRTSARSASGCQPSSAGPGAGGAGGSVVRRQEGERLLQRGGGVHGKAGREGRLPVVRRGDDGRAQAVATRQQQGGQDTGDRAQAAVEGDLAHEQHVGQVRQGEGPVGGQEPDGRGEVEGRAVLAQARGGEIHGDAAVPLEGDPAVAQGRADAGLALPHGGIGKAHHGEAGKAGRGVGLDADEMGLDAENGGGDRRGEHASLLDGRRERAVDGRSLHRGWGAGGPDDPRQSWAEPVSIVRTSPAAIRDPRRPFEAWRSRTVVPCWAAIEPSVSPGWMR